MNMTKVFKNTLSVMLCLVLIAAMALTMTACKGTKTDNTLSTSSVTSVTEIGEGKTQFTFLVEHKDGSKKEFSVKTDETTVGAALLKEELIAGEDSQYGLYVKTVDGETLDFDKDGLYWAFYVDGEYAVSGIDTTEITADANYTLKAQK